MTDREVRELGLQMDMLDVINQDTIRMRKVQNELEKFVRSGAGDILTLERSKLLISKYKKLISSATSVMTELNGCLAGIQSDLFKYKQDN